MRVRRTVFWAAVVAVLLPAALLTLNRVAEPHDGRLVRAASFTPLAIPLYVVLLVLALAALVHRRHRFGRRRRPRTAFVLLAVVAMAGLVLHGAWFSAQVAGANPPAAPGAGPITVMTANLYVGRADGIELVRIASDEDVDVLVVEEVTAPELAAMERAGVDALFPHRVGDTAPGAVAGHGTMVFSRIPLGVAEPVPTESESWQVRVGDLTLLAVHPSPPTDPAQWRADHRTIWQAVQEIRPDLVVGDFNATLDHRPMRVLAAAGWRSAAELANEGWQPTWPANGLVRVLGVPVPAAVQIDHVLLGHRLAALSTRTVEIPGADHRAVVAEVARK